MINMNMLVALKRIARHHGSCPFNSFGKAGSIRSATNKRNALIPFVCSLKQYHYISAAELRVYHPHADCCLKNVVLNQVA